MVNEAPRSTRMYVQHHGNMHMDARRMAGVPAYFQRASDRVPRDLWLSAIAASGAPPTANDQMAVHDLGERALVSFRAKPDGGAPQFVVDLWTHEGESWRLAVRYAGGAGDDRGVAGNVPTGALEKRGD